jgi:DNA polymerase
MFGVPIEKIKKGNPEYALRAKGKVAELALGYGGGRPALLSMGAGKIGLSDDELEDIKTRWRKSSPNIVRLWYQIQDAAMAVLRTGRPVGVKNLIFRYEGDYSGSLRFLTVELPSGRKLFYANPFFGLDRYGKENIHYYGGKTGGRWVELQTWGGKLTENVVQAIARDCLAAAMKNLEMAGYRIVMHIHDEVILDVPEDEACLDHACLLMCQRIPWAPGLLLNAAGFVGDYYKKD